MLPDASGRKTSDSFIRKDGDGGIERKIEARSDKSRYKKTNIKTKVHQIFQTQTLAMKENKC